MNGYRSVLASSGGGGSSLKDAYKAIVNTEGFTVFTPTPFSDRCTINEGQIAVDTTNKTVYIYIDCDIAITEGTTDYYGIITCGAMTSAYLPTRHPSSTRQEQSLTTDVSSSVPSKKWFVWQSSSVIRISVGQGLGFNQGEHYIIYGSWQY